MVRSSAARYNLGWTDFAPSSDESHALRIPLQQALDAALAHLRAGRLVQAEEVCRAILAAEPEEPEAWRLLGLAALYAGQAEEAVGRLRQAVECRPSAVALDNLAAALLTLGHMPEAESAARRAVELDPARTSALTNLGSALQSQARYAEAEAAYRRALALREDLPDAYNNLSVVLLQLRRPDEALLHARRAVELDADYPEARINLGACLETIGRIDESLDVLHRVVAGYPRLAKARNNLASTLLTAGRAAEAEAAAREALQLAPQLGRAWLNLGHAQKDLGRLDDATGSFDRALAAEPRYAGCHTSRAGMFVGAGRIDDALDAYRRAIELDPENSVIAGMRLMTLQYRDGVTPEELLDEHLGWARRYAAGIVPLPPRPRRAGPLRIGMVSEDFGRHPVGFFLAGLFQHLDPRRCQLLCYSDRLHDDEVTRRLKDAGQWRATRGVGDRRLAELIRDDDVDVLFDLAGHTSKRVLLFAHKPAPVQVAWIGYPGTTGLAAIDYLLSDRWQTPPGTEGHFVERPLVLPRGYVCFQPPTDAPPIRPRPADQPLTFGSLNNPAKISASALDVWAEVLRRRPDARLLLKYGSLDAQQARARIAAEMAARGIEPARIDFGGRADHAAFMDAYHRIDVVLDTWPYSGGLTTCEALWMGVPVVSLVGRTFAGRHAQSHLHSAGVGEWAVASTAEYIGRALALADDDDLRVELRRTMRERLLSAPLCDGRGFAAALLDLLETTHAAIDA